jgi:fucose permease
VVLVGFLPYWSGNSPAISIAGLFILGVGASLLYPLTVGMAISAAEPQSDAASARAILAFGIALLVMPLLLGLIADQLGLRNAHWLVPVLALAVAVSAIVGRAIQKATTASSSVMESGRAM